MGGARVVAGEPEPPRSAALLRFAEEAHAALAASEWTEEDGGEVPRAGNNGKEWWE